MPLPSMTEADLRAVLLLRAIESEVAPAGSPAIAAGPAGAVCAPATADTEWAGAEARRRLGEPTDPAHWLGERARLLLALCAERDPGWRPVLAAAGATGVTGVTGGVGVFIAVVLASAAALGAAGENLGTSGYINLLAPPLLGLLAWNLAVYLLLLGRWLWRSAARPGPGLPRRHAGPLQRGLLALAGRWQARLVAAGEALAPPIAFALVRFQRDWLQASAALQSARLVSLMHAAAAALAIGALLSMYARGLVLDYRAGWDSTFLDASAVRTLLVGLLGPAAALSGQPLPDAAALSSLRLATGGGEGAARWIHLWALTLLLAVVLPRLALSAVSAWQARRLAQDLPLPDDDGLHRQLRAAAGQRRPVLVLPYSYQLDAAQQAPLLAALDAAWGPGVMSQLQASLAMGAEDDLPGHLPAQLPATVVALFALTATPERETHGAFLRALASRVGPPDGLAVMVDESGFRQRLAGAMLAERLAQRRAAWQALVASQGLSARFVDLSPPAGGSPP
jgi:hypothetical protein